VNMVEELLQHYGVKGMKWGVRRAPRNPSGGVEVVLKNKGSARIKTSGGRGHFPSEDAVRTAAIRQKGRKSSVSSLSNKDLQEAIQRMNLERQYKSLSTSNPAKKFVSKLLQEAGQRKAAQFVAKAVKT